jgi:hypothetical protein
VQEAGEGRHPPSIPPIPQGMDQHRRDHEADEPAQEEPEMIGDDVPQYPDTAQRRLLEKAPGTLRAAPITPRRFTGPASLPVGG